jgi:hypothetical protein
MIINAYTTAEPITALPTPARSLSPAPVNTGVGERVPVGIVELLEGTMVADPVPTGTVFIDIVVEPVGTNVTRSWSSTRHCRSRPRRY